MVAQREPTQGGAPVQKSEHFVVVFPGYHRAWGSWIAHTLESYGHRTTLQRWDPDMEQPLAEALGDLQLARGRVLLVISDMFFQLGPRTETDWNSVLRGYVRENAERFAAVNLTNRELLPATAVLEPANLWDVGEEEAERRLLARLGLRQRRSRTAVPPAQGNRYPNDPPSIWSEAIPRRNARFTGRDVILGEIQQRLTDAERGAAVTALVGTAGIGKTHIAAEYAHRFAPDYDTVWWVNCDQRNTQRETFGSLATELGLTGVSEVGERVRAVREALRRDQGAGRWLLVFDGWEEPEDAATYLPQGGTGHVLITSRNQNWRASTDIQHISAFRRAESTSYLMRRARHITAGQADEVAEEFQDLPLQLAQAAAWLGQEGMEVPEYLRMVRGVGLTRMESRSMPDDYPRSSLTSWAMLLNKLRTSEPRAVELLSLCAAFAPGRIPLGLARGIPGAELPDHLHWISTDRSGWTRALDSLVNYSVLTRESRGPVTGEGDEQEDSVRIHQVVHSVISELTDGDERGRYREVVHRLLVGADPGAPNDSRQWPRYAELLPHLRACGAPASRDRRVQEMLLNCLRYTHASGEYTQGIELAETLRREWESFLPTVEKPVLSLTTLQGNLLRLGGRFREAHDLDSARVERLRELPTADESAVMEATSCLAADLRYLGQYTEALERQQRVVEVAKRLYGPEEWTSLLARHNLGVGLRLLGRYEEAYETDLDTLRKREQVLRARHPNTLQSGNACARDLRLMGRYQEAVARQELGMRLHIQVLGPQHPQTLVARHNMLLAQRRAGTSRQDLATAMATLLEQQEQVHSRSHHTTLALLTDYGNFLREHGDLDLAKELLTEAEDGFRALLGPAHQVSTAMRSNAGLVLQAEGEREAALNMFEQSLAGLTSLLGPDHPTTLGCALNASGGRNLAEALDDAYELSRDTYERAGAALGAEHPLTLSCMIANAHDLRSLRRREEAGKMESEALDRLTRSLGAQHFHTLSGRQRTRPFWDFEPYLG